MQIISNCKNLSRKLGLLLLLYSVILTQVIGQEDPLEIELDAISIGNFDYKATEVILLKPGFRFVASDNTRFTAAIVPNVIISEPLQPPSGGSPTQGGGVPGFTAGKFDVTPTGAATYQVPITVSPGRGGLEPELSILYNSQVGNTYLGLGFSITGISAITPVASTFYHDGVVDPVDNDELDRFLLDGQRLIAINSYETNPIDPQESASITEFRTENNSFQKILRKVTANTILWEVFTKSGIKLEYLTPLVVCKDIPISKITDTNGNTIDYSYLYEDGLALPDKITYVGGVVEFQYKERDDPSSGYTYQSHLIKNTKLVDKIITKHNQDIVREYRFTYKNYGEYFIQNLLTGITEYNADGENFNPVIFEWGNSNHLYGQRNWTGNINKTDLVATYPGDYNGDGRTDIITIEKNNDDHKWELHIAQENGSGFLMTDYGDLVDLISATVGDYNGDGQADFGFFRRESINETQDHLRVNIYYSNGTTELDREGYSASLTVDQDDIIDLTFGDYNGDAQTDILLKYKFAEYDYVTLTAGWGHGNYDWPINYKLHTSNKYIPLNFNGDGKNDLLILGPNGAKFCELIDGEIVDNFSVIDDNSIRLKNDRDLLIGDFNGDGKTDMISYYAESNIGAFSRLHICDGNSIHTSIPDVFNNYYQQYYNYHINDMNGDGRSDIVIIGKEETNDDNIYIAYARDGGQDFDVVSYNSGGLTPSSALIEFGDFDGDGNLDVLYEKNGEIKTIHFFQGKANNFVQSITKSLGSKIEINYAPLNSSTVYTPDVTSTDTYPVIDVIGVPMYVVESIGTDDGIGGKNINSYRYQGGKVHATGKGFLGFKKFIIFNTTAGTETTQEYEFHSEKYFTALKNTETKLISGNIIEQTEYTNTLITYEDPLINSYIPTEIISKTYEPTTSENEVYSEITSNNIYNQYGDITQTSQVYSDGSTITTTSEYYPSNEDTWEIGLLEKSTTVRKYKTEPSQTSISTFKYYGNRLTKEIIKQPGDPLEVTSTYTYDAFGNLVSETTKGKVNGVDQNRTISYAYADTYEGRFGTLSTNGLGHEISRTFDPKNGNILTTTGANLLTATYEYDGFGRAKKTINVTGVVEEVNYSWSNGDANAPVTAVYCQSIITSGNAPIKIYYDLFKREVRRENIGFNGQTIFTDIEYNEKGHVERTSLPYFKGDAILWTTITYDEVGREISQTLPGDRVTTTTYNGLTTISTNPEGQTSKSISDVWGQVSSVEDNLGNILTYTYNSNGDITSTTDPEGNKVEMQYDDFGNRIYLNHPDKGIITNTYNAFGEIEEEIDNKGQSTKMTYDVLGRLKTKTEPEGITTWVYDVGNMAIGKLSSVNSTMPGNVSQSFVYDEYGRTIEVTENIEGTAYTSKTAYDIYDRVEEITYPSNFKVKYLYNTNGQLYKVENGENAQAYWEATQANAKGQLENILLGNGLQTVRTYNNTTGFLENIGIGSIQNLSYTYDAIGNMTQRKDNKNNLQEDFIFDGLNRLKEAQVLGGELVEMTYDNLGNITYKSDVGVYNYENSSPYAVSSIDSYPGKISELLSSINYTSFDKVKDITEGDAKIEFIYGIDKERKKSILTIDSTTAVTKIFVGGYEKEITPTETKELHYISAVGQTIAIHTISSIANNSNTRYLHKDHLGSVQSISDEQGNLVEELSFDVWGKRRDALTWGPLQGATSFQFDRGYTGHEHLDLFALVNMNGRIYDPIIAKFLSPDPVIADFTNLQSFNSYTYVLNNPLVYTDPDGKIPFLAMVGIGAAIFGTTNLAIQAVNGEVNNFWDGAKAFGAGAVAGATITSGVLTGLSIPVLGTAIKGAGIIYGGAVGISTIGGLVHGITAGDWSRLGHMAEIFAGNFYLDGNRNLIGQAWQGMSRFSWELLQSTIGHGFSQLNNTFGGVDRIEYFGGGTFSIRTNHIRQWGISIGNHINISLNDDINGSFEDGVINDPLFMHEYGHTFDSQIFGLAYLFRIGIPSLLSAKNATQVDGEPRGVTTHDFTIHEMRANRHAARYFGKNYSREVDWDNTRWRNGTFETYFPRRRR